MGSRETSPMKRNSSPISRTQAYNQPYDNDMIISSSLHSCLQEHLNMAMAAAAAVTAASSMAFLSRRSQKWVFLTPFASSLSTQLRPSRELVLYSKPGCCLCDGLKERLQAAFLIQGPDSLNDVKLQIRDITTNPEWERSYQYEIPVLARVLSDGTEEVLPRLSPRLGVVLIQKKIAAALRQE